MATFNENREFSKEVVESESLLDNSINWINENLNLEEVFDESVLIEWAASNSKNHFEPEEVFDDDALEDWATRNGWTKEE